MKKMFYSELLDQYFNSEEECVKAELTEQKRRQELESIRQQEKTEQENLQSRKQAAKVVEDAEALVSEAYADLKKAEEEARHAYEKIVAPAKKKLQDAEHARYEAIRDFNTKYGVYSKRYTGKEAYDEFVRRLDQLDDIWNIFNL